MAEFEPGHPDELLQLMRNWLKQANEASPGSLLPRGVDPTEWAVRQFINAWRKPAREAIDHVEASLERASAALDANDFKSARIEINDAIQTLGESLRDDLGLYDWNAGGDE